MTIKTSHLILLGALGVGLANGENVRSSIDKGNEIKQEQRSFNDRIRANRDASRHAEKLSKVALDRYRANCIWVVDTKSQKEAYFQDGATVVDQNALNRPLRSGATICNRLGDTAIVQDGRITDIARVTTDDIPEFENLLRRQQ